MTSIRPRIIIKCPYCSNEINCDKYRLQSHLKRNKYRIKLCVKCNKRLYLVKEEEQLNSKPLKKYVN